MGGQASYEEGSLCALSTAGESHAHIGRGDAEACCGIAIPDSSGPLGSQLREFVDKSSQCYQSSSDTSGTVHCTPDGLLQAA